MKYESSVSVSQAVAENKWNGQMQVLVLKSLESSFWVRSACKQF